jgi:hypothetical protein
VEHLDLDLRRDGDEPTAPAAVPADRSIVPQVALVALVVLAIGAATFYFVNRQPTSSSPAPAVQQQPAAPAVAEPAPLGGAPDAVAVPPLDESDDVVRMLAQMLSANPTFLAWLASDDLIRTFTLTVVKVADGDTPATNLRMMRPRAGFTVRQRGEDILLDTRSYERYTPLTTAVTSIDPAASARLYATLKPRIEDAHHELGYDTPFDRTLERAIVRLLSTPVPDKPILLQPGKATEYLYVDPELERLTKAQKHLLRLGPGNARAVQASLRNIAVALGIPPEKLPAVP